MSSASPLEPAVLRHFATGQTPWMTFPSFGYRNLRQHQKILQEAVELTLSFSSHFKDTLLLKELVSSLLVSGFVSVSVTLEVFEFIHRGPGTF